MVAVGSKSLPLRRPGNFILVEDSLMGEEDTKYNRKGKRNKGMGKKAKNGSFGFVGNNSNKNISEGSLGGAQKAEKRFSNHHNTSAPQTSIVRKQVDPETVKYFSEITNLFESNGVEMEERSTICGNALEETKGKEFELATDYIISHTLQGLLEGCDVDHLCNFLQSCAKEFPYIAMDRSGSHVAETAIKSLAKHSQYEDSYLLIEDTLSTIYKVIVENPVDLMCNCYGSHVLRSLLCLCKGVALDSSEFHVTKSSTVIAERLNIKASRLDEDTGLHVQKGFPDLLNYLVLGIINDSRRDIKALQVDQYRSLVLQTTLKLLKENDEELLHIIPILLGCNKEDTVDGSFIDTEIVRDVLELMKDTAFSHLMEVVLEVAPEILYNEIFTKVFRNSLFKLSSHHCGNFVIQALISHARNKDKMELIWAELGTRFKDLLEMGKTGVVASLIAASQRLHTREQDCCQALATSVCSVNESPRCIIPRLLFLDSYFFCDDKSKWEWPHGVKIHVMGSLILQAVFRSQSELIQPFVTSITLMEADHALEVAKDTGGARVIEAFLSSDASTKMKRRLISKLRGHYGELSMHSSGSFTVEKCFNASNVSLRETIVSELAALRSELSKTKQGPYLLRKLDVEGFAARPDQWRSRQSSKQSAYNEFYATFGSGKTKSSKNDSFLTDNSKHTSSNPQDLKKMRKEIDDKMASSTPFLAMSGFNRKAGKPKQQGENYSKMVDNHISNDEVKKSKKTRYEGESQNATTGARKRQRKV